MSDTKRKRAPSMNTIGEISCLVCGERTPVKEQGNGYAAVSCSWCGFQGYARSDHSDALLRKKATLRKTEAAPANDRQPASEPKSEPKKPAPKASRSLLDI